MAEGARVTTTNMRHMYWTLRQMLVHHAVTGCVMRAGDLLGTGTISGLGQDTLGSMLELSWRGQRAVPVGTGGDTRTFLQDGDSVIMRGRCSAMIAGTLGVLLQAL